MIKRNPKSIDFTTCKRRLVQADFTGGDTTCDGGGVILREIDHRLQLTREIDRRLQLTTAIAKRFPGTQENLEIPLLV